MIKIFKNEEFGEIRTLVIDDEPYFVGKDVASVLGYKDLSHSILDHVDEEDRVNSKTQGQNAPEFGQRGTWLINESGLRNHLSEMNENQAIILTNSDVLKKDFRRLNNRGEKFLTESGVYKLIFKSKKKEAEKFQDWVTDDVLPSIRKHGAYMAEDTNYRKSYRKSVINIIKKWV